MEVSYELKVFETPGELNEEAAKLIVRLAEESIAERGKFVIALSGGRTPEKLYLLLSQAPYKDTIDWNRTYVFWGDERCVPFNDERNNARMAKEVLLTKLSIPVENIFVIPVNLPPLKAAETYEEVLRKFFGESGRMDLILLGLGENGHTASLFPGTPVINERQRWVRETYIPEDKMFRITLTVPCINSARNVLFLVTGSEKKEILKSVLSNTNGAATYPAQLIKPENGQLYWFVDRSAA